MTIITFSEDIAFVVTGVLLMLSEHSLGRLK